MGNSAGHWLCQKNYLNLPILKAARLVTYHEGQKKGRPVSDLDLDLD